MQPSRSDTLFTREHHQWAQSVIGGDGPNFRPIVRANLWNAECSVEFSLPGPSGILPTFDPQTNRVEWHDGGRVGMRAYPLDDGRFERGGLEWEIVLTDVPARPTLALDLDLSGVDLHHQGALSPAEVARGVQRPDNVVNSFVAMHRTRGPLHFETGAAEKYKTGKAFHLFRPEAIDNNGARMWIPWSFNPNSKKLTLDFDSDPQVAAWLQSAAYPVTIDPTVGYSTIPGSLDDTNEYVICTKFTAGANGDANPGTAFVYGSADSGTVVASVAVYANGAASPDGKTRLALSSNITLTTTPGFRSAAITWTGIVSGTSYFIGTGTNTGGNIGFDDLGATGWFDSLSGLGGIPPNPYGTADGTFPTATIANYVDFTGSGGGASVVPVLDRQYRARKT